MRVLLDDTPVELDAQTLGDALGHASRMARSSGRLVVEVLADGEALDEAELAQPSRADSTPSELLIVTTDLCDLLRDVMADAGNALLEIDSAQRQAADLLDQGHSTEAMASLGGAIAGWDRVLRAAHEVVHAIPSDREADADVPDINESVQQLADQLRTLREAMASTDPVGVTDTLRFEMPEVVTIWRSLLEEISQHLNFPQEHRA